MLKQRTNSKKKKTAANTSKNIRTPLVEKPNNFMMKFTDMFLSPKTSGILKLKQSTKPTKSSNITPSSKSRKPSKENIFNSVFYSKKCSEVSTPFECEIEEA